jgi:hypothetical protein
MGVQLDCEHCRKPLPAQSRPDKRFCDNRCRAAASKLRQRRARIQLVDELGDPPPERDEALERLRSAIGEATLEPRLMGVITNEAHSNKNWRAAAWLLENVVWAEPRTAQEEERPITLADLRRLRDGP